jgi:hypothetical protein
MRKSRFSEEQIIGVAEEAGIRAGRGRGLPEARDLRSDALPTGGSSYPPLWRDSGYASDGAMGYILKCLDDSSVVTLTRLYEELTSRARRCILRWSQSSRRRELAALGLKAIGGRKVV